LAKQLNARHINNPTPKNVSDAVIEIRQSRLPDPSILGNAGSFFHNPVVPLDQAIELEQRFPGIVSFAIDEGYRKLSAAWMIDNAGFKGMSRGGVGVYEKQALVLVNLGDGIGSEVVSLAKDIKGTILDVFNVQLSIEPRII
jgi:UDP-N-acetylmuramate dehydrogenase